MAAQDGGTVALAYGAQGSQQLGGTVLLDSVALATSGRVVAGTQARWQASDDLQLGIYVPYVATDSMLLGVKSGWPVGIGLGSVDHAPWGVTTAADERASAPWGRFDALLQPEPRAAWGVSTVADDRASAPWGSFDALLQPETHADWSVSANVDASTFARWLGPMQRSDLDYIAAFDKSRTVDFTQFIPWVKFSRNFNPIWGVVIPVDDGAPEALIVVPIRSVYMQVNSTSLRRVAGNVSLPTFGMNLSLDVASWVWSFSASLPAEALDAVAPVGGMPVELEATINGSMFRLLVERISSERTFGNRKIQITGRGKTAVLDAPYAPLQNFGNDVSRTVAQIMDDVLSVNGVTMGWAVNFGIEDWLVPGGVFSHRGSHMSALNQIAAAAGAYMQPHATADAVSILPRYPVAPWLWNTIDVDFELPSALMTREGIEWADKPRYNRVYVSGTRYGVLGRVTRAGSFGDLLAPLVTDPLITTAAAARQRGLPVLADVGRIANVSLRLPVLTETKVLTPGKFVRYVDGSTTRVGIVRSVAVDVASPQVWQTIQLETHV